MALLIRSKPLWVHAVCEPGVCVCVHMVVGGFWVGQLGEHMLMTSQPSQLSCMLVVVAWGITRPDSLSH